MERQLALKYLLHLVGDVHQPLRVADQGNEHGKKLNVVALSPRDPSGGHSQFLITPGSLFGYWDSAIVRGLGIDPKEVAEKLIAGISESDRGRWSSHVPHLWAMEAHQLGVDNAYGTMLSDMDTDGRYLIHEEELDKAVDIIGTQLSKAGVRLALILNDSSIHDMLSADANMKGPAGDPNLGRALAQATCSTCHVIAPDQLDARQFTTAPNFESVANTVGVTEGTIKDFLFGPHPTMPAIALGGDQANDVASFIMSLKVQR